MKRIILLLAVFMTAFFMPAHARFFPQTLRVPAVCWPSLTEALTFHASVYKELPILKLHPVEGQENNGVLLVNPQTPSWTFLYFKMDQNQKTDLVCSIATGSQWLILNAPNNNKTEL